MEQHFAWSLDRRQRQQVLPKSSFLPACLPAFLPTYLPTYFHTYLSTHLSMYLRSSLPLINPLIYLPINPLICVPTYLTTSHQPTYLPIHLPVICPPTYLATQLHTHPHTLADTRLQSFAFQRTIIATFQWTGWYLHICSLFTKTVSIIWTEKIKLWHEWHSV